MRGRQSAFLGTGYALESLAASSQIAVGSQGVIAGTAMETKARVRIIVNGEAADTEARTLAELIAQLGFAETAVATARNGDFVPRSARAATALAPDDRIEIVAPRAGG